MLGTREVGGEDLEHGRWVLLLLLLTLTSSYYHVNVILDHVWSLKNVLEKLTCKDLVVGGRSVFGRAGQTHHSLSVRFNQCLSTRFGGVCLPYLILDWTQPLFLICSWGDESHSPTAWIGWLDPGLWSFPTGPWSILDVDHTWKSICPLGQYLSPNISWSLIILRSQKFGWVSHMTLDQCDHASFNWIINFLPRSASINIYLQFCGNLLLYHTSS